MSRREETARLRGRVAALRREGLTVGAIARRLGLHPNNVSYHLRRADQAGLALPAAVTGADGRTHRTRVGRPAPGPCRHCGVRVATRPRGLCFRCYYADGGAVRELYPRDLKHGRRGVADDFGQSPPPDALTAAAPGSEAKVLILMERARKRQGLWHPADAGWEAWGDRYAEREAREAEEAEAAEAEEEDRRWGGH